MSAAASPTLRVLKWSFLGAGVVYGFWHNRTLAAQAETKRFDAEWARKEKLIADAKAAYAKKNSTSTPGDLITDVNDPNFDLEKLIDSVTKQ
ncbi:ATP synthase subunit e, mitochondrial [Trichomonascus vanleenenianus]|uniref:F1F0 ATP synthase subunit e n=1 Tax=Trichomonascus vanleenenianus TaxID=2268995 RepID=UPI003EC9B94F